MCLAITSIQADRRDELALADERMSYTWNELNPVLNRAIGALRSQTHEAQRVAVFAHNSAEAVMTYIAAFHAGASSVPVSFHLTAAELAYILDDSGSSVLFVGPETFEIGLAAAAQSAVETVVGWRCPPDERIVPWDVWLERGSEAEPPTDIRPRPQLHYTSGTTGRPKGTETPPAMLPVAESVQSFVTQMRARVAQMPQGPGLIVGPLYHTGPMTTVRALLGGLGVVCLSRFDAQAVLAAIERYRIANCVMVPTHFRRLLSLPAQVRERYDVSSVKRLAHTGAACPRDVKSAMIDWFGPVLVEGYGGTESGSVTMIDSHDWLRHPGSVGRPVPPFEVVVVGEEGSRLGPAAVGQLYFRDTTGRGIVYHNDPEKTAAAHIEPGVFTLGDAGYVDEEGFVYITDRVSDMIVSGGVNIYPAEAEQVLLRHPQVADVAIVGVPDEEMGEAARALIVPADPSRPPDPVALSAFCREHLAGYKCPRSYEFVADIGRNALGKLNKRALRRRYWPGERTIGG